MKEGIKNVKTIIPFRIFSLSKNNVNWQNNYKNKKRKKSYNHRYDKNNMIISMKTEKKTV